MSPDVIPESPSGSYTQEDPSHPDSHSDDITALTHRVDVLAEGFYKLVNGPAGLTPPTAALAELQDKLLTLQDKLSSLEDRLLAGHSPGTHSHVPNGDPSPLQFQRSHFPWVDNTTLQSVIDVTLDPAHLIKLIPPESRPKGQSGSTISGIN